MLNFDIAVFQFFAFLSKSLVSMPNKSYPKIEAHVFLYRMVLSKVEFGGPTPETIVGNVCVVKLLGRGWDMVSGK